MNRANYAQRRGGPLVMLGLLLGIWVVGRAALWESPFPAIKLELPGADLIFAESNNAEASQTSPDRKAMIEQLAAAVPLSSPERSSGNRATLPEGSSELSPNRPFFGTNPAIAAGHQFLMAAAFRVDWMSPKQIAPADSGLIITQAGGGTDRAGINPGVPASASQPTNTDRWSLDAFAFYRAGSNSAPISQGRVPVYGASQIGANLQYRAAPSSPHDPRIFVRAYRAMVSDGETEGAFGGSARPVGPVPVRVAAELRVTKNAFGTELRPAAYAVTELPSVQLPFGTVIEAYGGGGYVGGTVGTPFVDGQVAVTRELANFDGPNAQSIRLSLGGGAWGGAQEGASRFDIGPTLRVDLSVGEVPARISVDWRERVAGDAAPNSGIAATLSTRF